LGRREEGHGAGGWRDTAHVSVEFIEQVVESGDCSVREGDELVHELFGEFGDGFRAGEKVQEEGVVGGHG